MHINSLSSSVGLRFTQSTNTSFGLNISSNSVASNFLSYENTPMYFGVNGTNDLVLTASQDFGIGDMTPDGKLEVRQTGTDDIFNLYDNITNVFTVQDGGNVGIGTNSPTVSLDINGALALRETLKVQRPLTLYQISLLDQQTNHSTHSMDIQVILGSIALQLAQMVKYWFFRMQQTLR